MHGDEPPFDDSGRSVGGPDSEFEYVVYEEGPQPPPSAMYTYDEGTAGVAGYGEEGGQGQYYFPYQHQGGAQQQPGFFGAAYDQEGFEEIREAELAQLAPPPSAIGAAANVPALQAVSAAMRRSVRRLRGIPGSPPPPQLPPPAPPQNQRYNPYPNPNPVAPPARLSVSRVPSHAYALPVPPPPPGSYAGAVPVPLPSEGSQPQPIGGEGLGSSQSGYYAVPVGVPPLPLAGTSPQSGSLSGRQLPRSGRQTPGSGRQAPADGMQAGSGSRHQVVPSAAPRTLQPYDI
jgi:hypothetical protein